MVVVGGHDPRYVLHAFPTLGRMADRWSTFIVLLSAGHQNEHLVYYRLRTRNGFDKHTHADARATVRSTGKREKRGRKMLWTVADKRENYSAVRTRYLRRFRNVERDHSVQCKRGDKHYPFPRKNAILTILKLKKF